MKKKSILIGIAAVSVLAVLYFVGSGFRKNPSAFLQDYRVSADGKEISLRIGAASSMGYIRKVKAHPQPDGKLYLDCYSAFGGLNGHVGAKESFSVELNEDTAVIAVCRNANAYEEILIKAEDGSWQRVQ